MEPALVRATKPATSFSWSSGCREGRLKVPSSPLHPRFDTGTLPSYTPIGIDPIRLKAYDLDVKRRDFIRKIAQAGWTLASEEGPHSKYRKQGVPFAVPRGREITPGVVRAWEKLNREIDGEGS